MEKRYARITEIRHDKFKADGKYFPNPFGHSAGFNIVEIQGESARVLTSKELFNLPDEIFYPLVGKPMIPRG